MMDGHTEKHETELRDFFGDLERKVSSTTEAHRDELTSFFSGLGPAVDIARRAQEEMDRRAATKFSIFDYFHERETDLSRIFKGLLDPSDAHGQGELFLSLFLKETLRDDYSPPSNLHDCKVHLEYSTHERRRIDIVLEMPDNHWIGIENKPWAEEQEKQVEAYIEYLQDKVKKSRTAWILYLSGDGSKPETLPDNPELKNRCRTVPYRKNGTGGSLENWIEQCWRDCEAERVRWFLKDLLEYIQQNFKKENQVMAQDVIVDTTKEFIKSNEKYLSLALQVEKAMPLVKQELIKGVIESARKCLEEWREKENWEVFQPFDQDVYLGLRKKAWDWPEKNDMGWDTGVVLMGNQLKVHLPDDLDGDKFKSEFEKQVDQPTKKYTQGDSALVWQPYNLSETEEDLIKMLKKKDDIANELAEKMKEWATAVDNVCRSLKIEGGENSD